MSLKGADGADGADGAPGANGSNGTNGADGADGLSAYEVAVANGFIGTEAAWLLSLKGADGAEPICDRVWIQIDYDGNAIATLKFYIDTFGVSFVITQIEWQIFTGSIWEKIKIGGTTLVPNDPGVTDGYDVDCYDNDKPIRIKFTDNKGCIHYSNLARLQCP